MNSKFSVLEYNFAYHYGGRNDVFKCIKDGKIYYILFATDEDKCSCGHKKIELFILDNYPEEEVLYVPKEDIVLDIHKDMKYINNKYITFISNENSESCCLKTTFSINMEYFSELDTTP